MELTFFTDNYPIEMLIRVILATLLGLIIGLERQLTHKAAGLRTQTLVCLGSAVFTMMSLYGFVPDNHQGWLHREADPSRVAAQILAGVGFIGGGAVLKQGLNIYGITTAATLWMSASIGMAIGCGQYWVGIIAALVSLILLTALGKVEKFYFHKLSSEDTRIRVKITCKSEYLDNIINHLNAKFKNIIEMSVTQPTNECDNYEVDFIIDVFNYVSTENIYKTIASVKNFQTISVNKLVEP